MKKPYTLKPFNGKSNLYSSNKFICDICCSEKSNNNSDTLHCLSCCFDVCK